MMNAELYNALRKANVPEDVAEAAARSVASTEGLATKADPPLSIQLLAERVRKCRENRGWSQRELAKKAGVSQKTISNMENIEATRKAPKLDNVEKVARAFGYETWQLLAPMNTEHLIENFSRATPQGQEVIERVAELEAKYASN